VHLRVLLAEDRLPHPLLLLLVLAVAGGLMVVVMVVVQALLLLLHLVLLLRLVLQVNLIILVVMVMVVVGFMVPARHHPVGVVQAVAAHTIRRTYLDLVVFEKVRERAVDILEEMTLRMEKIKVARDTLELVRRRRLLAWAACTTSSG